MTQSSDLVTLEGVGHSFREGDARRVVLHGVDASVARGELVAVLGRSGSGKSTLLNLVGGLDAPEEGRILVAGQDLARLGDTARSEFRRRHIGFVFQFFHLLPTLTVFENVLLPSELDSRDAGEHARELLDRVGMSDRADAFPDVLSGGEQQRVALARAIAHRPELLLADEPTGNLDEAGAAVVLDLLVELGREHGCTVIMATHSRDAASRCERVVRIEHGRLVEAGVTVG